MFKRRNYSRYQNKSKRTAYAKGKYPMSKGRTASRYTLINTVQQVLRRNSELKYHDTAFSTAFTATATSVVNLSDVVQGNTDTTRSGDRLKITSFEMRYEILGGTTTFTGNGNQRARIILVHWFPATTPAWSDVMTGTTTRAHYNHDQRQMYKVLWDKTFAVMSTTSKDHITGHIVVYPKKNTSIQFQGGGATGTNRIYGLIVGDNIGASVASAVLANCRLRFTDS